MVSWQKISKYLAGSVGVVGLFAALFLLTGIEFTHTGDIKCGEICESYINVTTSYWRVCFENPSDAQRIYEPGVYSLQRTTIGESPDTVLYKKSTRGRTLWVNLNNVDNIISTNPDVIVDWLVPARGAGNWRPIKSGDCWERKKNNRIKLIGHKVKSQTVKWNFDIEDKVNIDPLWIGEFISGDSIDINVTQENNFTHLTISNQTPYTSTGGEAGLVLYQPFDENVSSTTTYDYTVLDNDGTLIGSPFYNSSCLLYGGCFELNGSQYIDIGTPSSELQTNNLTIMAWVNFAAISSRQGIIQDGDDDVNEVVNEGYLLEITSDNNISFIVTDGMNSKTIITSDVNVTASIWHHVAGRIEHDPGGLAVTITVFVDGNDQSETSATVDEMGYGTVGLTFGSIVDDGTRGNYMNGSIDEIMIFNHSLTNTEIQDIYNNQSIRFKTEGTQEFLSFNVSLTSENRVNVSAGFQRFFRTNVSLDLGLWNISEGYNDSIDGDGNDVAINDSVVLWFHFDNQSDQGENDTHAFDWSGNGNNGTGTNGAKFDSTQAVYNGSFSFDGISTNEITVGDKDIIGNITISAWINSVNPSTVARSIIVSKSTTDIFDGEWAFQLDTNSGDDGLSWNCGGSNNAVSILIKDGTWNHAVITMNEATNEVFIYTNNIQESFTNTDTCLIDDTETLFIGGEGGSAANNFNGSIDEVQIWNRTLSSTEVTELYNKGRLNYVYTAQQNLTASNENTTFTISNNTEVISPRFKLYSTNFSDPFYSPILQPNITYDFYQDGAVADSCTYTSGNWDIDCSDSCVLDTPEEIDGDLSLSGNGVVTLNVIMNFTGSNRHIFVGPMCELDINSGGGFN